MYFGLGTGLRNGFNKSTQGVALGDASCFAAFELWPLGLTGFRLEVGTLRCFKVLCVEATFGFSSDYSKVSFSKYLLKAYEDCVSIEDSSFCKYFCRGHFVELVFLE